MTTTGGFDPSRAPGALQIEHCDIPVEMTLSEWRRGGGRLDVPADGEAASPAPAAPAARKPARRGLRRALRLA